MDTAGSWLALFAKLLQTLSPQARIYDILESVPDTTFSLTQQPLKPTSCFKSDSPIPT